MAFVRPSGSASCDVDLPYGLWLEGAPTHRLQASALSGHDEMALEECLAGGASAIRAANLLLTRCASRDGKALDRQSAAALTLGDREVLLRAIYALTVSPRVGVAADCGAGCGTTLEFELDLLALPRPAPEPGPMHRLRLGKRSLLFRLPTGGDLERAVEAGEQAAAALVAACTGLKDSPQDPLLTAFETLDPNSECRIAIACPECGHDNRLYLDGFELLRRGLAADGGLLAQIDRIARAYGWSEEEILLLPRSRRLRYVAMTAARAEP